MITMISRLVQQPGIIRRHFLYSEWLQRALKRAVVQAGIDKMSAFMRCDTALGRICSKGERISDCAGIAGPQ